MDRRPRASVALVLKETELPRGLLSGQQGFHDDACENERFVVGIAHSGSFPRIVQARGGGSPFSEFGIAHPYEPSQPGKRLACRPGQSTDVRRFRQSFAWKSTRSVAVALRQTIGDLVVVALVTDKCVLGEMQSSRTFE